VQPSLERLAANARKLRIYCALAAVIGAVGTGAFAAYIRAGNRLEGPAFGFAVFIAVALLAGAGLFLHRLIGDLRIVRILKHDPKRVARIYPKRTESTVGNVHLVNYTWIVVELTNGKHYDVYAPGEDFQSVLVELRGAAPDAQYDHAWRTERTNLRIR
jgi:hypothetical protein